MNIKQIKEMAWKVAEKSKMGKRGIAGNLTGLIVFMIMFVVLFPVFLTQHASLTSNLTGTEQAIWAILPTFLILGVFFFVVKKSGMKVGGM